MPHATLGNDLQDLANAKEGGKISLIKGGHYSFDPGTGLVDVEVAPGHADDLKYDITVSGKMRIPTNVDWTVYLAAKYKLGSGAAIALGLKCCFERWFACHMKADGRWNGNMTLITAFQKFAPTNADVKQFRESEELTEAIAQLKLTFASARGCFPSYEIEQVPSTIDRIIKEGWYQQLVFINDSARPELTISTKGTDDSEWKACIPKHEAAELIGRTLATRLGLTSEAFGWDWLKKQANYVQFVKAKGPSNGRAIAPAELIKRFLEKDRCVVLQASVVVISDGTDVAIVERGETTADGKPRISPGDSFLISVSPKLDKPLKGQIQSVLERKFCVAASMAPLRPLGVLVNLISTKPSPSPHNAPSMARPWSDDGESSPKDKAFFVILVYAADVTGQPEYLINNNHEAKTKHWDSRKHWGSLQYLQLVGLEHYGDRAILHALKFPGASRVVGNGSAWFIDANHPENAGWFAALSLPT